MKRVFFALPVLALAAALYYIVGVRTNGAAGAKSFGTIERIAWDAHGSSDGRAMCCATLYGISGRGTDGALLDITVSAADPSTGMMEVSYVRRPLAECSNPVDCTVSFSDSGCSYVAHVLLTSNRSAPIQITFDE